MRRRRWNGLAGKLTKIRGTGIFRRGPKAWGQYFKENKIGICNPEVQSAAGKKGGAIVKQRKVGLFGRTPERRREDASKGGKAGAASQIQSGVGIHSPEIRGYGCHVNHHVNKGKKNPACRFCVEGK